MGDCWPPGIVLWGMVSNHHVLRWLKTVVVSDAEKAQVMRQVGIRKTVRSLEVEIAVEVSLPKSKRHQNRGVCGLSREQPGGCTLIGRVVSGT